MSLKDYIFEVVVKMAEDLGLHQSEASREEFLKVMEFEQGDGGIHRIKAYIACSCGESISLDAVAPERSKEEMEQMAKSKNHKVINRGPKGGGGKQVSAYNLGHSAGRCPGCSARYIAAWEFVALKMNGSQEFPLESSESPDFSSIGQSIFSRNDDPTVH